MDCRFDASIETNARQVKPPEELETRPDGSTIGCRKPRTEQAIVNVERLPAHVVQAEPAEGAGAGAGAQGGARGGRQA